MTIAEQLLPAQTEPPVSGNPYNYLKPTPEGSLFFGRKAALAQIHDHIDQMEVTPLLLVGQEHSGKSSLLQQINGYRLQLNLVTALVDMTETAVDSLSLLVWAVAKSVMAQWHHSGLQFEPLDKTNFIADPLLAFRHQCLQPWSQFEPTPHRLLLWDDLDALLPGLDNGLIDATLLNGFFEMLLEDQTALIFTCTASGKAALTQHLPVLYQAPIIQIGPLDKEAALNLIRQPVNYSIVYEVANYIYELTQGNAYQIQRLCHHLHQYRQQMGLSQLTVADVVHVASGQTQADNGRVTTWKRHLPTYTIPGNGRSSFITNLTTGHRWLYIMLLLLLLLISSLALAYPALIPPRTTEEDNLRAAMTGNDDQLLAAASPSVTTTATATNTPTQTAAPTATVTATPTPTGTPTALPTATTTPTATPDLPPPEMIRQSDGMVMVYIQTGTFIRGATEEDEMAESDERPQHEVTLDAFYIDKYEVSVAQYAFFLNRWGGFEGACDGVDCALTRPRVGGTSYLDEQDLGDGRIQFIAVTGYANYPINHVSWYGAVAYCETMGARLPTEAEWEYAARGTDGRLYPWGNAPPNSTRAVFQSESFDSLLPVEALPAGASPFGVYGMAGSMWEWVADWYSEGYYRESPRLNPPGPEVGFNRVIRGGAWPNNNRADRLRTSNRNAAFPDFISSTIGFRCAYDP